MLHAMLNSSGIHPPGLNTRYMTMKPRNCGQYRQEQQTTRWGGLARGRGPPEAALVVCCTRLCAPRPDRPKLDDQAFETKILKREFPTTQESKSARVKFGPHGLKGMFNVTEDGL